MSDTAAPSLRAPPPAHAETNDTTVTCAQPNDTRALRAARRAAGLLAQVRICLRRYSSLLAFRSSAAMERVERREPRVSRKLLISAIARRTRLTSISGF